MITTDTIVIRRAGAADAPRPGPPRRPRQRRAVPAPTASSPRCDGRAVAALDLADGRVVADPFARTADLVELLRLRAEPRPWRAPPPRRPRLRAPPARACIARA